MISVRSVSEETFEVIVEQRSATTHQVTLTDDYYRSLTGGKIAREQLIKKSFAFLLERESNSSILCSFELPVIGQYFPEYERTIRDWVESDPA